MCPATHACEGRHAMIHMTRQPLARQVACTCMHKHTTDACAKAQTSSTQQLHHTQGTGTADDSTPPPPVVRSNQAPATASAKLDPHPLSPRSTPRSSGGSACSRSVHHCCRRCCTCCCRSCCCAPRSASPAACCWSSSGSSTPASWATASPRGILHRHKAQQTAPNQHKKQAACEHSCRCTGAALCSPCLLTHSHRGATAHMGYDATSSVAVCWSVRQSTTRNCSDDMMSD